MDSAEAEIIRRDRPAQQIACDHTFDEEALLCPPGIFWPGAEEGDDIEANFIRRNAGENPQPLEGEALYFHAPEVQILVPQYLPKGVTFEEYLFENYKEYRRGFLNQGIYQFHSNNWYNDPVGTTLFFGTENVE